MKKLILICLGLVLLAPIFILAQASVYQGFDASTQIIIRYDRINWQTYEFYVDSNLPETEIAYYKWVVDNKRTYELPRIQVYFEEGEHRINLLVSDQYGGIRTDSVRLDVAFWSLYNTTFWWFVYGFVALIIVYYWTVKLIYLFNRKKVSKQAQEFLDVLDTHGFVEKIVESIVERHEKQQKP
jgi:hypothetical protein